MSQQVHGTAFRTDTAIDEIRAFHANVLHDKQTCHTLRDVEALGMFTFGAYHQQNALHYHRALNRIAARLRFYQNATYAARLIAQRHPLNPRPILSEDTFKFWASHLEDIARMLSNHAQEFETNHYHA